MACKYRQNSENQKEIYSQNKSQVTKIYQLLVGTKQIKINIPVSLNFSNLLSTNLNHGLKRRHESNEVFNLLHNSEAQCEPHSMDASHHNFYSQKKQIKVTKSANILKEENKKKKYTCK